MEALYNRLVPDYNEEDISKRDVFNKQNHLEVELLLYAAYKAYDTYFHSFQIWERRDAYFIRVIGILQNFLQPETAKIFCEGLYYVVQENKAVSDTAAGLKLKDGTSFYSGSDFALRTGVGFEFLVGGAGGREVSRIGWGAARSAIVLGDLCQKTKTTIFRELNNSTNSAKPINGPRT